MVCVQAVEKLGLVGMCVGKERVFRACAGTTRPDDLYIVMVLSQDGQKGECSLFLGLFRKISYGLVSLNSLLLPRDPRVEAP